MALAVVMKKMISFLFHRHCTAMIVGREGEKGKKYYVPIKFLPVILPFFKQVEEEELDFKTDGPLLIGCSPDFFDWILTALQYDMDGLSLVVN